jgi:hypothetical protein
VKTKASLAVLCVGALVALSADARADGEEATFDEATARAAVVEVEPATRKVYLRGDVELSAPPFVLKSDSLGIERGPRGLVVDGPGRVDFCPCLGTPVSIGFDQALLAPPGDLVLKSPTARVFGAPVFWLPYFWLRAPSRAGLLPPKIAYRAQDGLFVGGGAQIPWHSQEVARTPWPKPEEPPDRVLTLRAGGYTKGGAAASVLYRSEGSTTDVEWDMLDGHGVRIDLRGSDPFGDGSVAWDAELVRGRRALVATTDLFDASLPYDRAEGEVRHAMIRPNTTAIGFGGIRATAYRGAPDAHDGLYGPHAGAAASGAFGGHYVYDAWIDVTGERRTMLESIFAPYEVPYPRSTTAVRGEASLEAHHGLGPVALDGEVHGASFVLGTDTDQMAGVSSRIDAVASVPLGRDYETMRHKIEPQLLARFGTSTSTELPPYEALTLGPTDDDVAGLVGGGFESALGSRESATGWEATVAGGAWIGRRGAVPLVRMTQIASARWIGFVSEAVARKSDLGNVDFMHTSRARFGTSEGPRLDVRVASQRGQDLRLARWLSGSGRELGGEWLAYGGTSGGVSVSVPVSFLRASAGADGSLDEPHLLGARGEVAAHDRCGCFVIRSGISHRIGREGVDVWVVVDFGSNVTRYSRL